MNLTDDEIAERIAERIPPRFRYNLDAKDVAEFSGWFDDAEAYRLAFVADVRERAKVRRQAKRVRAKVFAALGVADRKAVEE
jgi:hypothetical protein